MHDRPIRGAGKPRSASQEPAPRAVLAAAILAATLLKAYPALEHLAPLPRGLLALVIGVAALLLTLWRPGRRQRQPRRVPPGIIRTRSTPTAHSARR